MVSLSHIILGCAKMKKSTFRTVIVLALLLAAEIVLSRFLSISLQNLKFGFSFLVVAFAAREFGFLGGAAVGGLGDLVGAILFPIGPYFPGFTLTAALCGASYAAAFKLKGDKWLLIALILNNFLLGAFLNSLWISLLYGTPFLALVPIRLVQAVIMTAVGFPALCLMNKYVPRLHF